MAPKTAPKSKAGAKAAAKAKGGREVIPEKKMEPNQPASQDIELLDARLNLLTLRAIRKMQKSCRLMRVQSAMNAICILEDTVLLSPTPGIEAFELILAGPKLGSQKDAAEATEDAEGSLVLPASLDDGASSLHSAIAQSRPLSASSRGGASQLASRRSSSGSATDDNASNSDTTSQGGGHGAFLTEDVFAMKLAEWGVEDAKRQADLIFWLLDRRGYELLPRDLDRVCRHHRIRRRNLNSKVHLYLALVQHGDAKRCFPGQPEAAGPLPEPRPLDPAGWEQVTRTAWALRLCPVWSPPGLLLHDSAQCCAETVARLRTVAEQPEGMTQPEPEPQPICRNRNTSLFGGHASHPPAAPPPVRTPPDATICEALDFPKANALLGPTTYYVSEALTSAIAASENPKRSRKKKPPDATPAMIVGGGVMIESLLACLTSGQPRENIVWGRLGGGDAILLVSPGMCQLIGQGTDERWRSNSALWEEALNRNNWNVAHHIRGSGRDMPLELGGIPKPEPYVPAEFKTRLTAQWEAYAGRSLILTDKQYLEIRSRAGFDSSTGRGLDPQVTKAMKPLVKDYVIEPDDEFLYPPGWQEEQDQERHHQRSTKKKTTHSMKNVAQAASMAAKLAR